MTIFEQSRYRNRPTTLADVMPKSRRRSMLLLMAISTGSWLLLASLVALAL